VRWKLQLDTASILFSSKLAVISRPGGKVVIEEKGLAKPGSGDAGG
jgi:hypothetical protein